MNQKSINLPEPRMVDSDALMIVGLKKRYSDETSAQIPAQWQAFQPHIGTIDTRKGAVAFGVMCNSDDEGHIDYLTGLEVEQHVEATRELDSLRLPPRTYAVFQHDGHVSDIRRTWSAIFEEWFPKADCKLVDAPQLERYGEGFDPQTGMGDIEIWIPVTK